MKLPYKKALVLAPHTDDGEFGCGGTISRLIREGCEVKYIAFSDCKESVPSGFPDDILRSELINATECLGIQKENVEILDYKVRYFPRDRQPILEDLVKIKKTYIPDVVFTPCSYDIHQDHNTIYQESLRAFKTCTILGYELPWNTFTLPSTTLIKLELSDVEKKLNAVEKYESQKSRGYSDAQYLMSLVQTRGMRIGVKFAEAFEMIRFVL